MRSLLLCLIALSLSTTFAADGDVLSETDYQPPAFKDSGFIQRADIKDYYEKTIVPNFRSSRKNLEVKSIFYESDGLKVKGFFIYPKVTNKKLPLLIFNRGGNGDYGKIGIKTLAWLSRLANRGYVIAASQYRGNDGGQGHDEFGGKDQNDVLNLFIASAKIPGVDTQKSFIMGHSRGGMMTYMTLRNTPAFAAAIVMAGECDLFLGLKDWPAFEQIVYEKRIPNYLKNKKVELTARSACFWPQKINTPIMIFQGKYDKSVMPNQADEALKKIPSVVDVFYFNGHHTSFFTPAFEDDFFVEVDKFFSAY